MEENRPIPFDKSEDIATAENNCLGMSLCSK
jgi:hypothetical protein